MRIVKGDTSAPSSRQAARSRLRHNTLLQVGLLVLAVALGFVVHQQGWQRPLAGFAASLARNPTSTLTALLGRSDLPTLRVDMRFRDYQRLLDRRTEALRRGVNLVSEQDYAPASISLGDTTVAVQMRLPAGSAFALSGAAWPFEVAIQDGALLGLRRFTLTPADATALSTWGYLETLRQAGLLAPRYELVRLVVNGSPRGLYALEELPTAEMLAAQGRPESVVVAFEPGAYWEAYARLGEALPGSGFQYAQAACAPYDVAASDSCSDAVRALRTLRASDWDAERTGAFLALTVLWRGSAALDWRTLRLAYDPQSACFEPIGDGATFTPIAPLPDALTDDPRLQAAYLNALARFSAPDYLTQLQADLGGELETLSAALGYPDLPWATLEAHQAVMRRMLAPSRPLLAWIEPDDAVLAGALVLRLSNVQPFPVEVVGLDIGESARLSLDPAWVSESDRISLVDEPGTAARVVLRAAVGSTPRSIRLRVPPEALPAGGEWVWQSPDAIQIITRLYGLDNQNIPVPAYHDDLPADAGGTP